MPRRVVAAASLFVVIALGLASRKYAAALPGFVAAHAGDALWTVAVYLTLAIVWPAWPPLRLAIAAYGISVAVELSQLVDVGWLNAARQTLPGRLLLGAGFLWADLLRYLAGALAALLIDLMVRSAQGSRSE